ncbi:MAG: gamma carbonic anhydrase family protein [Thermoanaerobaculales bacterium]|jgi:carbonic anhydrase/acetyltransferase-like protein (isoleucine patch superfamily)|nr:gamma carbonic anhydrase family protein [Thermoanaerobaculales bacterium]
MTIQTVSGLTPSFGKRVFVAANAVVVGDVRLGDDVSVWFNVVLRGDIHWIRIGDRSNLQDGAIVHVERGLYPTVLAEEVSVGHGALLHGCTIGAGCLIGMGAVVLNQAVIGEGSLVAAGAVVREGFVAPPRSLVAGVPAVVKRPLSDAEAARARTTATNYLEYKNTYLEEGLGRPLPGADHGDGR